MRRLMLLGSLVTAVAAAGCAAGPSIPPTPTASATPASASATPASASAATASASAATAAIVGEWIGVHDCARIVAMMREAGLDEFALEQVYGNGLVPGVTTEAGLKDPAQPCDGAVERQHSHFFTADGAFGSKDFNGQQVDDGRYTLEGDDVVVINGFRFQYQVDGDSLKLEPEPVDTSTCTTKMCRFGAAWVLMVALPGTTWTRGEIPSS
jgi:hypothetical protein